MADQLKTTRRTADLVFRFLQQRIISGELGAGQRIDLDDVAATLQVSRTPVREALLQLEQEGLIERRPYRGAIVRGIDVDVVTETFALRLQLETLAARVAAPRLTEEDLEDMARALQELEALEVAHEDQHRAFNELNRDFHNVLAAASGTRELLRYLDALAGQAERVRMHYDLRRNPSVHAQHEAIYAACLTRDPEEVVAAVRGHIIETLAALLPVDHALDLDSGLLGSVLSPAEATRMAEFLAARKP